jgi:hypothetical protein
MMVLLHLLVGMGLWTVGSVLLGVVIGSGIKRGGSTDG